MYGWWQRFEMYPEGLCRAGLQQPHAWDACRAVLWSTRPLWVCARQQGLLSAHGRAWKLLAKCTIASQVVHIVPPRHRQQQQCSLRKWRHASQQLWTLHAQRRQILLDITILQSSCPRRPQEDHMNEDKEDSNIANRWQIALEMSFAAAAALSLHFHSMQPSYAKRSPQECLWLQGWVQAGWALGRFRHCPQSQRQMRVKAMGMRMRAPSAALPHTTTILQSIQGVAVYHEQKKRSQIFQDSASFQHRSSMGIDSESFQRRLVSTQVLLKDSKHCEGQMSCLHVYRETRKAGVKPFLAHRIPVFSQLFCCFVSRFDQVWRAISPLSCDRIAL